MQSDRLLLVQRQLIITILCLVLGVMLVLLGYYFADVLRILGISLLLSYMGIPAVDLLAKRIRNRAVAVMIVYLALLAGLVAVSILLIPALVYQISQLIQTTFDALPKLLQDMTNLLAPLEAKFRASRIELKAIDLINNVVSSMPKPDPSQLLSRVSDVAVGTVTWLVYLVSISVNTFYFLLEGSKISDHVIGSMPAKSQNFLHRVSEEIDQNLQTFFRGQIVLGFTFGLIMLCVFALFGVRYALLLGIFLGIMEVFPVIGPPIGFIPAVLSIAFHGSHLPGDRFIQILVITAVFAVLQQFKDSVVAPKYIGNVLGLHPILIFIAIMIGARIDGIMGTIFAIPVACVVNVVYRHYREGANAASAVSSADPTSSAGDTNDGSATCGNL